MLGSADNGVGDVKAVKLAGRRAFCAGLLQADLLEYNVVPVAETRETHEEEDAGCVVQ